MNKQEGQSSNKAGVKSEQTSNRWLW